MFAEIYSPEFTFASAAVRERPTKYYNVLKEARQAAYLLPDDLSLAIIKRRAWMLYNRVASAAGPLTRELRVALYKATAGLFARSTIQLEEKQKNTSKRIEPATAESGGGKAAKAKSAATNGFLQAGLDFFAARRALRPIMSASPGGPAGNKVGGG